MLIRESRASDQYTLRYNVGDTTIAITGTGFARPQFLRFLGALVDSRGATALLAPLDEDRAAAQLEGGATPADENGPHHCVKTL